MVSAVRPLGSLSMARGGARIDSRLYTAKNRLSRTRRGPSRPVACSYWGLKNVSTRPGSTAVLTAPIRDFLTTFGNGHRQSVPACQLGAATNGLMRRNIALSSFKSSSPGWIAHRCSLLRPCALRPGHFDGFRSTSMVTKSRSISPVIADQPQTRTRRTRQAWPSQKRCVTHSQLPKSSYGPGPAP